jgi:cell division transport system permease protein
MKYRKNILSFMLPLFIVLISFAMYSTIINIVDDYRESIINDYAIVAVASTPIDKASIVSLANIKVKQIQTLKREDIFKTLEKKLSKKSLTFLSKKLPFFYKIYLNDYPSISQLNNIKQELKTISNIKRVETFSSNHSNIYSLLIFSENIIFILFLFLTIFAILVISKQINIWFLEHNKRISIIDYHGGSIFYSAMPIIKTALANSFMSSILTIIIAFVIVNNLSLFVSSEILKIIPNINNLSIDIISIFMLSFIISFISIAIVLIKYKIK